jgi:hypothetical protein
MPKDRTAEEQIAFAREQARLESTTATAEETVPNFDEAPATVNVPALPQVKAPPVKTGKGQVQPVQVETTTTTTQTVRPAEPVAKPEKPAAVDIPDPVKPTYDFLDEDQRRFAQALFHLATVKPPAWRLRLWRISPPHEELDGVPQSTIEDVLFHIIELPEACYRLKLQTEKGIVNHHAFQPVIETRSDGSNSFAAGKSVRFIRKLIPGWREEPKLETTSERRSRDVMPTGELSESARLRQEREVLEERRKTDELKRDIERERNQTATEKEKQMNDTVLATLAEMKAQLAAAQQAPKGPSLIEILTAATPLVTAYLAAQSNKGSEIKDAMNLIIETNKAQQQMQLEQLREMRETAQRLIDKQASNPMEQAKMMMDLQQHGEDRAMKMMEMFRDRGDDDDMNLDPAHPWSSLALEGFKTLVSAFKSGAPEIVKMIASRTGKPAEQVTEADLKNLYAQMQQMPPQQPVRQIAAHPPRALPPVQPAHHAATVGAQIHAPVQFNPDEHAPNVTPLTGAVVQAKPTGEPVAGSSNGTGMQSDSPEHTAPVVVEVPAATTPTEPLPIPEVSTPATAPDAAPAAPTPAPVSTDTIVADKDLLDLDLREHIDVCLREFMLVDLQTERQEHEWPLYAAQKWHKDFNLKLCLCETHDQRMDMVRTKADATLFAKIMELWKKDGSANGYNLLLGWGTFIREVMTPQTAPEASASTATTEGVKA